MYKKCHGKESVEDFFFFNVNCFYKILILHSFIARLLVCFNQKVHTYWQNPTVDVMKQRSVTHHGVLKFITTFGFQSSVSSHI